MWKETAALDELQLCLSGVGFRFGKQWELPSWRGLKISVSTKLKPTVAFKDFHTSRIFWRKDHLCGAQSCKLDSSVNCDSGTMVWLPPSVLC